MAVTEKQLQAINSDGSNVLVSASAGSGKTFVMIERVKRLILQKGIDIDKILCVTFTVLAAKEMKQKIADAIADALKTANEENSMRLERQMELLPTASISTMHSFCKSLLSEFFYEAGLDPSFAILDDKNTKLLINRAIDRLFEDLYEQNDENLRLLLPYYFKGRKDKALKEKIISIYHALISEADPKAILEQGRFYYSDKGIDLLESNLLKNFNETALQIEKDIIDRLPYCEHYAKVKEYLLILLTISQEIYTCTKLEELCMRVKSMSFRKPSKTKNTAPDEAEEITAAGLIGERVKSLITNIKKFDIGDLNQEKERAEEVLPVYNALAVLVLRFMEYFAREKREENSVDYSDLEHFTLKLLQNDEIKNEIASRFSYIFTDEYQDTSGVQEAILTSIARDNLFMVGDLKQSIYDFRGCNPDIFAKKYIEYSNHNGGEAINLDKNFRSTHAVLDCVNSLFEDIMTMRCGSVDYKKTPMEVGADYPEKEGEAVMCLAKKFKGEKVLPQGVYSVVGHLNVLNDGKCFAEGRAAAELIENLIGTKYYDIKEKDKDNKIKSIDYGDIAILLRDANKDADKFTAELIRAGIPVSAPSKDSIGNYAEVALAINILKLIDCYNQDIPLASVLKSEIGKVSDSELLQIRKFCPKGSFVEAVKDYADNNDDELSKKLIQFEEYFNSVRMLAEFIPCGELLSEVVRAKGLDIKILSSRLGEIKLARLNKFIEVADASKQTVGEFLKGLDGLLEKITLSYATENAVKIMSIHASKGLEFPVVILGRTTKGFNAEGVKGDFLVDRDFGVSINHRDVNGMVMTESLFNKYVKLIKTKRMREEEMRLLYVAMTRAKNSLYVMGEYTKEEDAFPASEHPVDVFECSNYFKMFALKDFEVKLCNELNNELKSREVRQVLVSEEDAFMAEKILTNLTFEYPNKNNSTLSVKRSVTQAVHFKEEEGVHYEKSAIYGESDTEIGNAYHKFLELCDFSLGPKDAVNSVIGGLLISDEYKKHLDRNKLERILQMPIFETLKGYTLYKEQPFIAFIPASIVQDGYVGNEQILVQGIIDLLAINGDEAIIVDYKHSTTVDDEALKARYKKQLKLYAYAVESVLKRKVKESYLVNVNTCKTIKVEL